MGTPLENIPQVDSVQYSVYSVHFTEVRGQYSVGKVRFAGVPFACGSEGRDWFMKAEEFLGCVCKFTGMVSIWALRWSSRLLSATERPATPYSTNSIFILQPDPGENPGGGIVPPNSEEQVAWAAGRDECLRGEGVNKSHSFLIQRGTNAPWKDPPVVPPFPPPGARGTTPRNGGTNNGDGELLRGKNEEEILPNCARQIDAS